MFSFPCFTHIKRSLWLTLLIWSLAVSAQAACLLDDGPPNTLVPDGYHFAEAGQWKHCKKGSWSNKGPVTDERPYTPNDTGVCLPLENQFTKKDGVISMNFVPEKTRLTFYGFEHECVASTWWRVPSGAKQAKASKTKSDPPPVEKETKKDPLAELEDFYKSDSTPAAKAEPPVTAPAPEKPATPAFSFDAPAKKPEPAPKTNPAPALSNPNGLHQAKEDYKACRINCQQGKDLRLANAEKQCKVQVRARYGKSEWSEQAERDYNRCRILAARRENNQLRACLLPCKKQAGQNVWRGP